MKNYNNSSTTLRNGFIHNRATIFLVILFSIFIAVAVWFATQNYHKSLALQSLNTQWMKTLT